MITYKLAGFAAGVPDKDSSMLKDFAAGVDPTGTITFDIAMRNKKRHHLHKTVGAIGGFIGGATLIPGAISALAIGVPRYLSSGQGRSLKMITSSALKPYKLLYHGAKGRKELSDIVSGKGTSTKNIEESLSALSLNDVRGMGGDILRSNKRKVDKVINNTPSELLGDILASPGGTVDENKVKAIADWGMKNRNTKINDLLSSGELASRARFIDKLVSDKEFADSIRKHITRGLVGGAGAITLSGATNSLSSVAQYNSGLKAQKAIKESVNGKKPVL